VITEARNDVFGKSGHLGFEWLELQHEEFDAGCVKFANATGDGIVGAHETYGRSAIGPDSRRLGHRLLHHHLGISIELLNRAQRRIFCSEIEKTPACRMASSWESRAMTNADNPNRKGAPWRGRDETSAIN
jgi:hypothetical protein